MLCALHLSVLQRCPPRGRTAVELSETGFERARRQATVEVNSRSAGCKPDPKTAMSPPGVPSGILREVQTHSDQIGQRLWVLGVLLIGLLQRALCILPLILPHLAQCRAIQYPHLR